MNVNIYLPDDIAKRAKDEGLNLSRMLRDAVTEELDRRHTVSETLNTTKTHELDLENEDGELYTGRITGTQIAEDDDVLLYLADDERVIAYDAGKLRYSVLGNEPRMSFEEELRAWLPNPAAYQEACDALGIKAVIDL